MTSVEIRRAMNEFIALYPSYYKNLSADSMERIARSWQKRFEDVTDYDVFVQVLYDYEADADYPNPPSTKQWLTLYRNKAAHKNDGKETRRIVTPEEEMYNIYLEEMEKPADKRDEWLIRQCLPAAKIMTDPNEYIRHFGKPREEYEKL